MTDLAVLIRQLQGLAVQYSGWEPLVFTAPWGDYGSSFTPAAWREDGQGNVEVRGLAKATGAWTAPSEVAVLPAGERPPFQLLLPSYMSDGTSVGAARVDVTAAGQVRLTQGIVSSGGAGSWVALDGIRFSVEA